MGLPRKAVKGDTSYTLATLEGTRSVALGWQYVGDLPEGTVTRRVTDDMHPEDPIDG